MDEYQKILSTYPDTVITFGATAWDVFADLLKTNGARKIAVFSGRTSIDSSGARKHLDCIFSALRLEVGCFNDIEPEPCIDTVKKMTAFLRRIEPDEVIAIGGGSPLDAAKAAYLEYQTNRDINDFFGVNLFSTRYPDRKLKKVICFPTTSGTGSEATPYSNIVDHRFKVKRLVVEAEIIPEHSFVVPELALSMPESVTRATGCDALAHSLEGFLNIGQDKRHPLANDWALKSISLIKEFLPRALKDGSDMEAREALAAAATLGGMVIRYKSTGLPHLCSFSWFGKIEHGIAVALLLPGAWQYYIESPEVAARTMELKNIFPGETPSEIISAYRQLLQACGLPESLRAYPEITPQLLELTARSAGQNKMKLELAPRPVPLESSYEIIRGILEQV